MYIYYVVIFLVVTLIALLWEVIQQQRTIDKKNTELIKYHLDAKFMRKCLLESIEITDSGMFCHNFVKKIQEYYYLEDIIIIDSLYGTPKKKQTILRKMITNYIKDHVEEITFKLNSTNLIRTNIILQHQSYILYISRILSYRENNSFIICVEKSPSLLAHQERISLENSINLLRNRMLM